MAGISINAFRLIKQISQSILWLEATTSSATHRSVNKKTNNYISHSQPIWFQMFVCSLIQLENNDNRVSDGQCLLYCKVLENKMHNKNFDRFPAALETHIHCEVCLLEHMLRQFLRIIQFSPFAHVRTQTHNDTGIAISVITHLVFSSLDSCATPAHSQLSVCRRWMNILSFSGNFFVWKRRFRFAIRVKIKFYFVFF